ncbi:hypothetical protein A5757_17615 [Mycobacterium sp. 852013-51886_SCH5428379]|uniref:tetratricopeptide repeat protein n=1 Tax=Mycobacterium sp. 852013-51886_SCH5428379 TaxID=1834111 RepID=UPI0007FED837|nr:tetratricopeptide repeat protein [Mycobacterium sp. 852013-51886_SCH5428379]OBB58086.1 hypothetical protein A5757_17615 [Mycobacterium sp. 852013-51886_SCH5428379]
MTTTSATGPDVLADAAFGTAPNRWPLPAATTPYELWLRAVAAGGQGRYAAASTDLDALTGCADPSLTSLAMSTRASFLRQLGGHREAARWDGRALLESTAVTGAGAVARADALIGLAADALGVGRFAASQRLLDRAADACRTGSDGSFEARLPVRLGWVRAELAMARGDGTEAVRQAERAVAAAADFGSARHRVKSDVVLAAARCTVGDLPGCREIADATIESVGRLGLVPLRWALASLLAGVGSDRHPPARVTEIMEAAAAEVRERGGVWFRR